MAQKPLVVTEAEWEKDKENVQRIETPLPGFPDAEPLVTYVKVEFVDDLTGKPADDVECIHLLVPVEEEREVVALDDEGNPKKNADGSDELTTETYWDVEPREIDLSAASLKKLVTALKPFAEKSRPRVVVASRPAAAKSSSGTGHDLTAIREWARTAGHTVADKGRIPGNIIDAYYNATGKKRPDNA